jgi:tRNA A37 threonylcarbamoyltransferase TsaD
MPSFPDSESLSGVNHFISHLSNVKLLFNPSYPEHLLVSGGNLPSGRNSRLKACLELEHLGSCHEMCEAPI